MSRQIALKEATGPTVEVTYQSPVDQAPNLKKTEFDLSNSLSLRMFVITLQLARVIPELVHQIEREEEALPPNVIRLNFRPEEASDAVAPEQEHGSVLSLKDLVRRSMRELDLNDPSQYVHTLVTALVTTLQAGEATVVTY
jgi:hypothetical protein